ncbi:hypothetical protein LGK95_03745 [Clostridium algoriphilum]|uniref:hypothetical protein n=1 Tax=Clostridium algoriphilum TaxID=198347 RepID=UPI001CF3FE7B|nr:hypothetical protein [Clostridium algoriphilum]MCB2292649.1 hypothetical protein [Clostridium algoriphilum]
MELTLKIIFISDGCSDRYNRFYNIENKYLLGDGGMLIDRSGKLLWKENWQHSNLGYMIYLENSHMLITDRHAMPGPCTMSLGICGIDMNNGKYLWKHWYEDSYEERMAIRQGREKVVKDIRLISFRGGSIAGDYILTNRFKIHLKSGEYELLEEGTKNHRTLRTEEPIRPVAVIHDTVNYRGSIQTFALNSESKENLGDRFPWYQKVISAVREQKILSQIKIYGIVEFFDNNLLIVGKDMKIKKDAIWLLTVKED